MYDIQDEQGIPVSAGIPPIIRISAIIGVIIIFAMVGIVIGTSWANHVWPAADSLKLKLNP